MKRIIQWIIGLCLLGLVMSQLSLETIIHEFHSLVWPYLALSLGIKLATRVFATYKWYVLLKIQGSEFTFRRVLSTTFVGSLLGSIGPVGVDFIIGFSHYKQSGKAGQTVSSMLLDRLIGVSVLVLIASMGFLVEWERFGRMGSLILLSGATLIGLAVVIFAFAYLFKNKGWLLSLPIPTRWKKLVEEVFTDVKAYIRDYPGAIVQNVLVCLLVQGCRILAFYTLALGVGVYVPFSELVIVIPIFLVLALIPIAANILGVQEGILILLLGMVGISGESAFIISILNRALTLISLTPGLFWVMQSEMWSSRDGTGGRKSVS